VTVAGLTIRQRFGSARDERIVRWFREGWTEAARNDWALLRVRPVVIGVDTHNEPTPRRRWARRALSWSI
jgi:hypothetical protein